MSPAAAPKAVSTAALLSQFNEIKSQTSRTQRLWLMTFGIAVSTLLMGVLLIQIPWQERRQQLASRYREEKERSELLLGIQQQKSELREMESKFLLQGGATGLAGQISHLAAQSGLQIESVTPQPEGAAEPYTRFQIEITATSTLANVFRFLQAVEEHRPLVWVEQMDMGESSTERASASLTETPGKPSGPPAGRQKVRFLIGAVTR